ncbi:thymidylate synthase [Sodalis ligni]|jgi:thymidylate synthase|uniref:Thymidylate synthase n=1 Tax=Sodalis ligni TaxID=2697027 RepID=A0A4R1N8Z1_9GAMM|nr:thymidylate synthase [Sodalis ligni]TCL03127.1 thymidylate synthase [Sodalis ligni]
MNRNITSALLTILNKILKDGSSVGSRDQEQTEVLSTLTKINNPYERFLVIPGRNNNVFAQIAETMWVLAGRNDLGFLENYLPRAVDFSDDGKTWRAAYGPRLRNWNGEIDQITSVIKRFKEDPLTKRAVISIFDPGSDYQDTKDVPCNNWIHFIQRNSTLDVHVTIRANDAIWGFSGINFFEWSVLHEIIAKSLGWRVGTMSWYVGTFHIYNRHYKTAERLIQIKNPISIYECGISHTPIETTINELDKTLELVFEAESYSRKGFFNKTKEVELKINDPFFKKSSIMLKIYNAIQLGIEREIIFGYLTELGYTDFRISALEYLSRKWKDPEIFTEVNSFAPRFFYAFELMKSTINNFEMT